jgi:hypothetical protein
MKRVLIASLFSLAAAPVFAASTPSFNDFPEQGQLEAGRAVIVTLAPSFNDQADLDALRAEGVAGRAATEVGQSANAFWTPY